jgi:ribosomal protein S18 acetylase RimI-like enzyme
MKFNTIITTISFCTPFTTQCCENINFIHLPASRTITIRPATLEDLNAISYLSQKNYHNTFKPLWEKHYAPMTPSHHTIESFVQEKINLNDQSNKDFTHNQTVNQNSNQKLLVAELTEVHDMLVSGGESTTTFNMIAGFCRFEKKDPTTMYINFILVAEELRKRGIAKRLAQAAMNSFEGVTECKFRALVHYDFVNDLYSKHNCEQTGAVSLDPNTGEISTDPNAPITHVDYSYTIKK